jgi:hypothetical protein
VSLWLYSAHFGPDTSHRSSNEFPLQDLIEFVRILLRSVGTISTDVPTASVARPPSWSASTTTDCCSVRWFQRNPQ